MASRDQLLQKNKPIKKLFLHEQERFWDNVAISTQVDCWLWKGRPSTQGYGRFSFRHNAYKAHRIAYFLVNGRLNDNLLVLHTCDMRLCCNPAHLYQGDAKRNSQDALKRGRHTRMYGEQNGKAKLTEKEVRSIRNRYQKGDITQKTLAQYHGVGETAIYYICKGERWVNLPDEATESLS